MSTILPIRSTIIRHFNSVLFFAYSFIPLIVIIITIKKNSKKRTKRKRTCQGGKNTLKIFNKRRK